MIKKPAKYIVALGALCIVLSGLSGCASNPSKSSRVESRNNKPSPAHSTQMDDPEDTYGDAIAAPLEDLNLKRAEIPPLLIYAIKHPYDLKGLDSCEAIANEVTRLSQLIGDDFDEPEEEDDRTMTQKGGKVANDAAKGAVRGAARHLIPFRGIVRTITGADRHEKEVNRAIKAGNQRRAYLKGVGMNRNCAPPAAPSWFVPRGKLPKKGKKTNSDAVSGPMRHSNQ